MKIEQKIIADIIEEPVRRHKEKKTNQKGIFPIIEFMDGTQTVFPAYMLLGLVKGSRVNIITNSDGFVSSIEEA